MPTHLMGPNYKIRGTMSWTAHTLWNHWGLKRQMRLRKSVGPIVWSSFLPDSHSGTYQCARSSVCARLRLACAWHYNVAKEFPSSRILHPLKKWCDYEFTTLNFWNVDFSQAKSSVTSLSGSYPIDDCQKSFSNIEREHKSFLKSLENGGQV